MRVKVGSVYQSVDLHEVWNLSPNQDHAFSPNINRISAESVLHAWEKWIGRHLRHALRTQPTRESESWPLALSNSISARP